MAIELRFFKKKKKKKEDEKHGQNVEIIFFRYYNTEIQYLTSQHNNFCIQLVIFNTFFTLILLKVKSISN